MTRYSFKLLRAGSLALDGGGMFGLVPKVVWEKLTKPDAKNRIPLAHNCLLLTRVDDPTKRIVIETGSGDKFDAKSRELFGLNDQSIRTEIEKYRIDIASIDDVIVTHLHFDHAGGLTTLDNGGNAIPTFPNAVIHVQHREWNDANANNSVMTRTYLKENLDPIKDRLRLLESQSPFALGEILTRESLPENSLDDRLTEILPSVHSFLTPGHTWGQQSILFHDEAGQPIVFVPDLIPTANHVGAAYNTAYDVEPFASTVNRRWFLNEAVARNWKLVLCHDPGVGIYRATENDKRWFDLMAADED